MKYLQLIFKLLPDLIALIEKIEAELGHKDQPAATDRQVTRDGAGYVK